MCPGRSIPLPITVTPIARRTTARTAALRQRSQVRSNSNGLVMASEARYLVTGSLAEQSAMTVKMSRATRVDPVGKAAEHDDAALTAISRFLGLTADSRKPKPIPFAAVVQLIAVSTPAGPGPHLVEGVPPLPERQRDQEEADLDHPATAAVRRCRAEG